MGKEIERTFLVDGDGWQTRTRRTVAIRQGYLQTPRSVAVRVRLQLPIEPGAPWTDPAGEVASAENLCAQLTLKGAGEGDGAVRDEFEYPVPADDAAEMLALFCDRRQVRKVRHVAVHDDREWVVDEFVADNEGLVLSETELETADEPIAPPDWLGREVTGESQFANAALAREPWTDWET